jgi:hypothetical protein
MIAALLVALLQAATEDKTYDRAPGEIVDHLRHVKGVVEGKWVSHFQAELEFTSEQGNKAFVTVGAVANRKSLVRATCTSGAELHSCVAHVWAALDQLSRVNYQPLEEKVEPFTSPNEPPDTGALHVHGYAGVLFGDSTFGSFTFAGPAATGGAEVEKWWGRVPNLGYAFGLGFWDEKGEGTEAAMFDFTLIMRGRIAIPVRHCSELAVDCLSLTLGGGPNVVIGSIQGPMFTASTTLSVGIDGRLGMEGSLSKHFGWFSELRVLATSGKYDITTAALLAGLVVR